MVSGDFVLIFQDLIPAVIPSQKCHMNMGPILRTISHCDHRTSPL